MVWRLETPPKDLAKIQVGAWFRMQQGTIDITKAKGRAFNPPKIFPEDRLYLDAWQELATTRPPSVPGAKSVSRYTISWLAIHRWAVVNSVPNHRSFARILWKIDEKWLDFVSERDHIARENDAAILGPNGQPVVSQQLGQRDRALQ